MQGEKSMEGTKLFLKKRSWLNKKLKQARELAVISALRGKENVKWCQPVLLKRLSKALLH